MEDPGLAVSKKGSGCVGGPWVNAYKVVKEIFYLDTWDAGKGGGDEFAGCVV